MHKSVLHASGRRPREREKEHSRCVKRSTHEMQLLQETFSRIRSFTSQIDDGTVNNNCEICNDTHHLPISRQCRSLGWAREREPTLWSPLWSVEERFNCKAKKQKFIKAGDTKKVPFSEKNNSIPNRFVVRESCYRFPRNILQFLRWLFKEIEAIFGLHCSKHWRVKRNCKTFRKCSQRTLNRERKMITINRWRALLGRFKWSV